MTPPRFLQLDVFPASAGGGNPLGVVLGAEHWSDERMQRFAAWTQLVETTYLLPPRMPQASYRLRIFTPHKETPFAGHPSIGSAYAALKTGFASAIDGVLQQECAVGVLPLRVATSADGSTELYLRTPAAEVVHSGAAAQHALAPVLADHPLGPCAGALMEGGRRWWVAELASEDLLRNWRPPHAKVAELAQASHSMGLCVFARTPGNPDHDLAVRTYPAGAGISEDPASGAANGLIAAWIAHCEPGGELAHGYRVSQGREIGHDARLLLQVNGGEIWVGGGANLILDGTLAWPTDTVATPAQTARTAHG